MGPSLKNDLTDVATRVIAPDPASEINRGQDQPSSGSVPGPHPLHVARRDLPRTTTVPSTTDSGSRYDEKGVSRFCKNQMVRMTVEAARIRFAPPISVKSGRILFIPVFVFRYLHKPLAQPRHEKFAMQNPMVKRDETCFRQFDNKCRCRIPTNDCRKGRPRRWYPEVRQWEHSIGPGSPQVSCYTNHERTLR